MDVLLLLRLDFIDLLTYMLLHSEYIIMLFKNFKICNIIYIMKCNKIKF
jgi:hypothetical protein